MHRTRIAAAAAALGMVVAVVSGCAGTTSSDTATARTTLVVARAADVTTLNADSVSSSQEGWETLELIADPLFTIDADGTIEPRVAESYSFDTTNTVLTITLRSDAVFSNGDPVTSADVAFTIENAQKGELQGALYADIQAITTPDDQTVVIQYSEASSAAVTNLASYAVSIIPADFAGEDEDAFWQDPITVGAWTIASWDQGSQLTLERNDSYYGTKPTLQEIQFTTVPDENTRLLQLQNGTVDLADGITSASVDQIASDGSLQTVELPAAQDIFFTVNTTSGPMSDEHARRAVSLAIDRSSIVAGALGGHGSVGGSFVVSTAVGGYSPEFGSEYDADEASAELAESAYPDGFDLDLMYSSSISGADAAMQIVQQDLAAVGITATLSALDDDAISAKMDSGDWDTYLANIIADTDAGAVLQYYSATNGFYCGDTSMIATVEGYYEQANADFDGQDARNAIFAQALEAIADSAVQIALYDTVRIWGASAEVQDLTALNTTGAIDFSTVTID
ncbi:MAG: ABC transporter substrate-binding protein [Microbacteriaceae bacterium]